MAPLRGREAAEPIAVNNSANTTNNNNFSPNSGSRNDAHYHSIQKYLTNCRSLYSCIYCRTHLANHDELVSRSFQGNHGRAYLFNSVINISCGQAVQRFLNTGSHAVADIYCSNCRTTLGWKYEKAYVEAQKYKEGKFIIELAHVIRENRHLEIDKGEQLLNGPPGHKSGSPASTSKPPSDAHSTPSCLANASSATIKINKDNNARITLFQDDDEEELMFPLYEDLYNCKSTLPSSLNSSQHSRMRRSLYLKSTPYDWKSSSSHSQGDHNDKMFQTKPKLASSVCSSDLSPTTSSSPWSSSPFSSPGSSSSGCSPGRSPEESSPASSYQDRINAKSSVNDNMNLTNAGCLNSRCDSEKSSKFEEDHRETQFEFDVEVNDQNERSISVTGSLQSFNGLGVQAISIGSKQPGTLGSCVLAKKTASTTDVQVASGTGPAHGETVNVSSAEHIMLQQQQQQQQPSSSQLVPSEVIGTASQHRNSNFTPNQVSFDDEEFFDCCSEHEIIIQ